MPARVLVPAIVIGIAALTWATCKYLPRFCRLTHTDPLCIDEEWALFQESLNEALNRTEV